MLDRQTQDIYSRLLQDGIVFVRGEIDDDTATNVTAQLLFLETEAPDRDIQVYINSPGGSLTGALSIYDTMQYVGPKIVTLCTGIAASGASLLLASGDPGMRMSLPHAQIHLHQPLTQKLEGKAGDVEIYAKEMLRQRERIARIYAKHCHRPLEAVESDMERDFFMTPEQAKAWGMIDAIVEKAPAVRGPVQS
jgi:ATP-dependent Clp protease protease subunit